MDGCDARVAFATAHEWVNRLGAAKRASRLDAELERLGRFPLLVVDEVAQGRQLRPAGQGRGGAHGKTGRQKCPVFGRRRVFRFGPASTSTSTVAPSHVSSSLSVQLESTCSEAPFCQQPWDCR